MKKTIIFSLALLGTCFASDEDYYDEDNDQDMYQETQEKEKYTSYVSKTISSNIRKDVGRQVSINIGGESSNYDMDHQNPHACYMAYPYEPPRDYEREYHRTVNPSPDYVKKSTEREYIRDNFSEYFEKNHPDRRFRKE